MQRKASTRSGSFVGVLGICLFFLALACPVSAATFQVISLDWQGEKAEVHIQNLQLGPASPAIDLLNKLFEERAKTMFDEAKKKYETMDYAEIPADMQWSEKQETSAGYDVRQLDDKYLSLIMTKMEADYGMAHPFVEWTVETYDLATGQLVASTPWDEKGKKQAETAVTALIKKRMEAEEIQLLEEKLPAFSDYANQFFLDKGEIVLYWPPYQFTPWSNGFLEFPTGVQSKR